ncbi:hypothetical protein LMG27952_06614 [Paraburkholderia hiiakae]|uniref:Uncharacterized protein n=2 Tax=Paraburkholderia hiiakae TaxID=1081782 RepID=A0ABN7IG87_9BURK|nr:hypothetical protein LMG27952_06614 [Paraburkholderia hiiakae]
MMPMNMEPADTLMLNEAELREQYANLQQRALLLGSRGQSRITRIAEAMHSPPTGSADAYIRELKNAADDAKAAVLNFRRAHPFLETGNSLIESLAKPSPSTEDDEWRDQLLFRLAEVLAVGADLIEEGEACLERSARVDI